MDLSVKLNNLKLKNPLLLASGCVSFGEEISKIFSLNKIGGLVTKTVTLNSRQGNEQPRIFETKYGLLNTIGLQNPGFDFFYRNILPALKKLNTKVIISIGGNTDELQTMAKKLSNITEAVELNLSCPNVQKSYKKIIAQDKKETYRAIKKIKEVYTKTIIAKLSPNVTDILEIAFAAKNGGADILCIANTYQGMAINIETKKSQLSTIIGGYSGPAIKPLTLKLVYEVAQENILPIVACGGIVDYKDVLEYLIAGASAVQIGTANFFNPLSVLEILKGLKNYLIKNKIKNINEIIKTIKI